MAYKCTRRDFHKWLGLLALELALLPGCTRLRKVTGLEEGKDFRLLLASPDGNVGIFESKKQSISTISLGWAGAHGFLSLDRGARALVVGKHVPHLADLEVKTDTPVIRRTVSPYKPGMNFYGHAAFSHRYGAVVTSEAAGGVEGMLVIRDPATLKPLRSISSHGRDPHDLAIFDSLGLIMVCNGRSMENGVSNIAIVELESGKLLHSIEAEDKYALFGHFSPAGPAQLVASTQKKKITHQRKLERLRKKARKTKDYERLVRLHMEMDKLQRPEPSFTYVAGVDGSLSRLNVGDHFRDSISGFSVCTEGGVAAVTHGPTQGVAFYRISDQTLISFSKIPEGSPLAISGLPNGDFLCGTGTGEIWRFPAPAFASPVLVAQGISSEHSLLL